MKGSVTGASAHDGAAYDDDSTHDNDSLHNDNCAPFFRRIHIICMNSVVGCVISRALSNRDFN
jgi:hypothetical protein